MRVELLADVLLKYVNDVAIVFEAVEDARAHGCRVVGFALDLGEKVQYAAVFLEYVYSVDEVYPIALIIEPVEAITKNIPLSKVQNILDKYGGYIYGSGDSIGMLIPINDEDSLSYIISTAVRDIVKSLLGYDVEPRITRYEVLDVERGCF